MSILSSLPTSEQKKIAAWQACRPIQGHSPADYRIDAHFNVIAWSQYGSLSEYGWEIDHVHPSALGGSDHPSNLRALHWRANRSHGGILGGLINRHG